MDKFFESTGAFGKYQIGMMALMGGISSLSSMCIYATVFSAADSTLTCYDFDKNLTVTDDEEKCKLWSNETTRLNNCKFDKTYYDQTIITEWNLVCDREILVSITQTLHMIGAICSCFIGYFGDRYGRRKTTLIFLTLLCVVLSVSELFSTKIFNTSIQTRYFAYAGGQFLIGMIVNCCYCIAYTLLLELTSNAYKTKFSNVNSYIYVIGELNVMLGYYVTKNWHYLNCIIIAYSIIALILAVLFLPESPEWLKTSGQNKEAYDLLYKIAKINGRKKQFVEEYNYDLKKFNLLSNSLVDEADSDKNSEANIIKTNKNNDHVSNKNNTGNTFFKIFYPKNVFIKTAILIYVWFALNLLYYGISLGITSINAINPYYMFFLSCVSEVIGVVLCHFNDIYGRKKTFSAFLVISGVTCLIVALIPHDFELTTSHTMSLSELFIVIFAIIGKGAISGAYNIIYIYTSELYSTNVRNTALLFLVCIGSVGSLIAPQINYMRSIAWNQLPYVIFCANAIIACICVIFLPETKGKSST